MAKQADKKPSFFAGIMSFLSWCAVLLLWASAAGIYLHPALFKWMQLLELAFPLLLGFTLLCFVLSLLLAPRQAWITVFGIMACIGSVRDYCPVNLTSPPPKGCIKVLTYNVMGYAVREKESDGRYAIPAYIADNRADIVCCQEVAAGIYEETFGRFMPSKGYFADTISVGENILCCFSRFKIVRKQPVFVDKGNGCGAFWLLMDSGDSLVVLNTHLASNHLSSEERSHYHHLVKDADSLENALSGRSLQILSKLTDAAVQRARQADTVIDFMERLGGERKSFIVCGDFNDTPVSYAHHLFCNRLTDVYRATANGIGRTFNRNAMYVRIDHIFCSQEWKPFACTVDRAIVTSDHYPVFCYLKRNGNGGK